MKIVITFWPDEYQSMITPLASASKWNNCFCTKSASLYITIGSTARMSKLFAAISYWLFWQEVGIPIVLKILVDPIVFKLNKDQTITYKLRTLLTTWLNFLEFQIAYRHLHLLFQIPIKTKNNNMSKIRSSFVTLISYQSQTSSSIFFFHFLHQFYRIRWKQ